MNYFKEPLFPEQVSNYKPEEIAAIIEQQLETKECDMTDEQRQKRIATRSDPLSRILFVYAKLNPGISYIQGMNEVLAVLFYTFDTENVSFDSKYTESDLFAVFTKMMEELRDCFLRELDKEATGIQGQIQHYCEVLSGFDPELHSIIEDDCEVPHQFYVMRWYMLLMCQEF